MPMCDDPETFFVARTGFKKVSIYVEHIGKSEETNTVNLDNAHMVLADRKRMLQTTYGRVHDN